MKSLLPLFTSSFLSFASAATVSYTFESNSTGATTSGSGFTAGSLTEGGNISTGAVYGRLTGTSAPLDTTVVRAFIPNNVNNQTNPPISTHPSYLEFTITPGVGQTLDFSAATFSFTLGALTGNSANGAMTAYANAGVKINSGSFVSLGSTVSANAAAYDAAAPNWTSPQGFNTSTGSYDVVQSALSSVSLASILAGLAPNDTVTFRIAFGDNSTVTTALNVSGAMKSFYVDDINVTGFNVIPEPSAALLGMFGLGAVALLRRRL